MITEASLRAELVRQLDAGLVAGKAVAELLGIAPPRVTEMKKGTRTVQHDEMERLAGFLGVAVDYKQQTPISRDELTAILEQIHGDMPASLPNAEYARYVASALQLRLDMLARDRSSLDSEDLQA